LEVDSSLMDTITMAPIKILGKVWMDGKFPATLGGIRGGHLLNTCIMIDIRLNSPSKFGIGFQYRSTNLHYYSMRRIDVHLLVISISFIVTKFNI
jgi:hypothetical protein